LLVGRLLPDFYRRIAGRHLHKGLISASVATAWVDANARHRVANSSAQRMEGCGVLPNHREVLAAIHDLNEVQVLGAGGPQSGAAGSVQVSVRLTGSP
jgi:hypothetical protein